MPVKYLLVDTPILSSSVEHLSGESDEANS